MSQFQHRILLLIKGKTFSNFLHLSLNHGANLLIAIVLTPYLFKRLGEDQYGLISLALTVILLFGILVNYGFGLNVPKQLALVRDNKESKQQIINEIIVTRLAIAFLLVIIVYILAGYSNFFSDYSTILLFSVLLLVNDALYPMFILQGFDRLSWISKTNAIAKLLYLVLVLLLVKNPDDAKWVNFSLGVTGVGVNGLLLFFIYRYEAIRFQWVSFQRVGSRIADNFQFFSSTIASYILVNGGFILLGSFVSNTELGYYAVAQRVSILLRMIPVFLTQSILQNATRLYSENIEAYEEYLNRSYKNGLLITFAVGVAVSVTASWIIQFLTGDHVELSITLMRLLSFLPFIGMLNVPNMIKILVTEQKQILAKAIWITTGLMLCLSSLGSYYFGSIGLAIALIISEFFNYWIHHYLIVRAGLIRKAISK